MLFSLMVSIFTLLFLQPTFLGCNKANGETRIRQATHADGLWYPNDPKVLSETVDNYLSKVKPVQVPGKIIGLIVPHAGYRFCAHVSAHAYKLLLGKKFDTVVIIGPSHHYGFPGVAIYESGVFRNPLGDVQIDEEITKKLLKKSSFIRSYPQAHIPEHSIEVQIPFLQRTLKEFKIVPILMQDFSKENCDMLSNALADVLKDKNALLIASTDMSHYPTYDEAVKADKFTISALQTMNTDVMRSRLGSYMAKGVKDLHCMLCGEGPLYVVVDTAKKLGANSIEVLKYANSGDVPEGRKNQVVGYMAGVIYESKGEGSSDAKDTPLNEKQQEELIKLARNAIETYLKTGQRIQYEPTDERLKVKQGAFVTLRKHGMLRGCIGYIVPVERLSDTIIDMAIAAATEDTRFRPVTLDEMKDIDIEISVLSIPRRVQSIDEIEMGKHGVIVSRGIRKGVFLPQVATETGWDKITFLRHLCQDKAGLPPDAWKDKDTEIQIFTAQVFEEKRDRS